MTEKYQIRTTATDAGSAPMLVHDAASTKENGTSDDGNLEQRQQKMTETRDSLNKMRARLQKLKVGATPAKSKAEEPMAAAVPNAEGSASKATVSNLRDRLKMWQAKHAS